MKQLHALARCFILLRAWLMHRQVRHAEFHLAVFCFGRENARISIAIFRNQLEMIQRSPIVVAAASELTVDGS